MDAQASSIGSEYAYTPQISKGVCPYCGKQMIKHITKEGARYHVLSWGSLLKPIKGQDTTVVKCSEPDCECNHGPGHCVPLDRGANDE